MKKNNAEKYKKNIRKKKEKKERKTKKERKKERKSTIKGKVVTKNSPHVIRTLDLRVLGSV